MSKSPPIRFETELKLFTIATEKLEFLADLVAAAREDFNPRNFAERHLVDELAISKWRICRVALMEKAVFERQSATSEPGTPEMPHQDIYHLAMAHAPNAHAVVLAALHRLDARYFRQFCTALRLLIALRRATTTNAVPNPDREGGAISQATAKETPSCAPSPTTHPAT